VDERQVTVGEVTADELDALLSLYRHLPMPEGPAPPREDIEDAWREVLAMPRHHVLVHREEGRLIASCALQVVPNLRRGPRPYGVIENVVVEPAWRRRGLATRLLHAALERAWAYDCYKVMLQTGVDNPHTQHVYGRAGFQTDRKRAYEAFPPGT
jgi:GNAT superfamily N-acetyltransferase